MTLAPPQCVLCVHLREDKGPLSCKAYPKGIPTVILENRHDHRQPWRNDNGIRFEAKPQAPFSIDTLFSDRAD